MREPVNLLLLQSQPLDQDLAAVRIDADVLERNSELPDFAEELLNHLILF